MSDRRLELLWDHFQIREVIEAYVHACDRADRDAVADIYHEDSYDHHGPISGPGHQFATDCVQALVTVWDSCNHRPICRMPRGERWSAATFRPTDGHS